MTDTTTAGGEAAKPNRRKVSERLFINSNGEIVDRMEEATGARYTLVEAGRTFDLQFGPAGAPVTMFAIFGAHTKLGNVANTTLNDKDDPGTPAQAADEIAAFIEAVNGGTWREASDGPRGAKYDNAVLAKVLLETLGDKAKGDEAHYLQRLEEDKSYRAKVVAQDSIKAAYWIEMSKRGVEKPQATTDSLA